MYLASAQCFVRYITVIFLLFKVVVDRREPSSGYPWVYQSEPLSTALTILVSFRGDVAGRIVTGVRGLTSTGRHMAGKTRSPGGKVPLRGQCLSHALVILESVNRATKKAVFFFYI